MSSAKHYAGPRFVYFRRHRWAQCYCARAASWTFRNLYGTLYGQSYVAPDAQSLEALLRLQTSGVYVSWFIREPIARLLSVYRRFAALEERFQKHGIVYPLSNEMWAANRDGKLFSTIDEFAQRAISDFPHDKHIALQEGTFGDIPDFMAPLEHPKAWLLLTERVRGLPENLPQDNAAPQREITLSDSTREMLAKFYWPDTALHERLWREIDRA